MKYAIITVTNGTFLVREEGITSIEQAKKRFHYWCGLLWNDEPTLSAYVAIFDENLDVAEGYKEYIYHEPTAVQAEE